MSRLFVTLHEYIAKLTRRPRLVHLQSLLMETTADGIGWESLSMDDPEVKEIVREHFSKNSTSSQVEVSWGESSMRLGRDRMGNIVAQRSNARLHGELVAQLAKSGFRFPTSEEWEYACGAGTPTLFCWGDHVPCDRYPTDISPVEAAWRRQRVLSSGKLEYLPESFISDWALHRRPNAFGIYIASDPYKYELVAEPEITRGSDGGCTICGGAGFLVGWLTLATAYFEEHACQRDPKEPIATGYTIGRRALPLAFG